MEKLGLKTGGHHAMFSVLKSQKIKYITKHEQNMNKTGCFYLHSSFYFSMVFLTQRLVYATNI